MPRVVAVRCPRCGSTEAGDVEAFYEITMMGCQTCGHREPCDTYQIKEDWNVSVELAEGSPLPARLAPLLPFACVGCRALPERFELEAGDFRPLDKLQSTWVCNDCSLCYHVDRKPGAPTLTKIDPATSVALRATSMGTITESWLAALRAVPGFSESRYAEAISASS